MEYGSLLNPPDPPEGYYPDDYDPALNGIGGWLVLVIIGRFLSIIMGIKSIADISKALGLEPSLDGLLYLMIIVFAAVYIILSGVVLYFIFSRKIVFRILFVAQVAADLVLAVVFNAILANKGYDTSYTGFFQTIIGGAIWIAYLYKSKRVKNTYIYPYQNFGEGPDEEQ